MEFEGGSKNKSQVGQQCSEPQQEMNETKSRKSGKNQAGPGGEHGARCLEDRMICSGA